MSKIISYLSEETALAESVVSKIVASAPRRYKTYWIEKRSGGERMISQPAREVKALQRILLSGPLKDLRIHPSAMAYREGISIVDNAKRHAGVGRCILKMDFANFFPSITSSDWRRYCHETRCLVDEEDVAATSALLFHQGGGSSLRLAIGAPSSPTISNALMFDFDEQISALVAKDNIVYTRYADDLTFSAPRTGYLKDVVKNVRYVLKNLSYPRLRINNDKTVVATTKYRRNVTGLVLANDGRVTIGRHRKRVLHAMIYKAKNGDLSREKQQYLAGYLAFASAVEPEFLKTLSAKYGEDSIAFIRNVVLFGSRVSTEVKNTMTLD